MFGLDKVFIVVIFLVFMIVLSFKGKDYLYIFFWYNMLIKIFDFNIFKDEV